MMPVRAATRRTVFRAAALAAAGAPALAAACTAGGAGGAAERSPAEGQQPGGKITWSFWAVSQEQADNALARLQEFKARNPGIQVDAYYTAFDVYREKIVSMVSAGTPPEVTQVDAYWMPGFVQQGTIQRLDAYIK